MKEREEIYNIKSLWVIYEEIKKFGVLAKKILLYLYIKTYVGFRNFGLQICDRFGRSKICRSMLIEAAHLVKSLLFLQSKPGIKIKLFRKSYKNCKVQKLV